MIEINNLNKSYKSGKVLDDVSFKINDNELFVIVGKSGSGKSTLLRCIDKLESYEGTINGLPNDKYELRRSIGYVVQGSGLLPHLTALGNIKLLSKIHGTKFDYDKVLDLANLVHLDKNLLNKYPSELSGGERQRVGIIRALYLDPKILLCDEPFSALDPLVRRDLQNELLRIKGSRTIILVTHDIVEASILADRVLLLNKGKVEQIGTPTDLKLNPATDFVSEFMSVSKVPVVNVNLWRVAIIDIMDENHTDVAVVIDNQGNKLGTIHRDDINKSLRDHPDNLKDVSELIKK